MSDLNPVLASLFAQAEDCFLLPVPKRMDRPPIDAGEVDVVVFRGHGPLKSGMDARTVRAAATIIHNYLQKGARVERYAKIVDADNTPYDEGVMDGPELWGEFDFVEPDAETLRRIGRLAKTFQQ